MGEAILAGWLESGEGPALSIDARSFCVAEPGDARRLCLQERYGVSCVASASQLPFDPDLVILAVKPQVMADVLHEISACTRYAGGLQGPLFISIAAGLSTSWLEDALPTDARLVRVMPNTPLMVGQGASGLCTGSACTDADLQLACDLFACLGRAFLVPEDSMDAVCAVSGSGPAYVAALIEAVRDGAVAQGLDPRFAEDIFLQTVQGTAALMRERGQDAEQTRLAVCSPGGTTLAALEAMEREGFAKACKAGVAAATARSKELAAC